MPERISTVGLACCEGPYDQVPGAWEEDLTPEGRMLFERIRRDPIAAHGRPDLGGERHFPLEGAGEGAGRIGQRSRPQLTQRLPVGRLRLTDLHAAILPQLGPWQTLARE